jgi:hypothetical protein
MFDSQIILICLIVVILLCLIFNCQPRDKPTDLQNQNGSIDIESEEVPCIRISADTYKKMVNIVTDYSMMSSDHNAKMILIYLSTFHLFDMNYGYLTIKKLDDKIKSYPYFPNNTQFPEGNMHYNLQKAIISHITLQIVNSERQLIHDKEKDRTLIDVYLYKLFTGIGIM